MSSGFGWRTRRRSVTSPYGQNIDPRLRFEELKRVNYCPAPRCFTGPAAQTMLPPGFVSNYGCHWAGAIDPQLARIIRALPANSRSFLMVISQEPTQWLAASHRSTSTRLRVTRKQQDVGLPLVVPLNMVMLDVFTQCTSQGALTKENDLRQALLLYRSHPAFRIGIQVRTTRRQPTRPDAMMARNDLVYFI